MRFFYILFIRRLKQLQLSQPESNKDNGPKIVAIGGGTGLSILLKGLKAWTHNITAIVTIADDGGSSGILRSELGMPPPGDARNCLVALSEVDSVVEDLFQYQFGYSTSLDGHRLGNLVLAALYELLGGFPEAIQAVSRLLKIRGRVIPISSSSDLVLRGKTADGQILYGESAVGSYPGSLSRVWIEPENAEVNKEALEAVEKADLIVIGPGSLYTSVLPNFMFPAMRNVVAVSNSPKLFVCNVATEHVETSGFTMENHLNIFQQLSGINVTHILANSNCVELPLEFNQGCVYPTPTIKGFTGDILLRDVVDESLRTRHDPHKLASEIIGMSLYGRLNNKTI